jgi:hypothetical protein
MPYEFIQSNKAKCLHCNDILISEETEIELKCTCGKLTISGGQSFLLRSGVQGKDYQEMSDMSFDKCPGVNEDVQELTDQAKDVNNALVNELKKKYNIK